MEQWPTPTSKLIEHVINLIAVTLSCHLTTTQLHFLHSAIGLQKNSRVDILVINALPVIQPSKLLKHIPLLEPLPPQHVSKYLRV